MRRTGVCLAVVTCWLVGVAAAQPDPQPPSGAGDDKRKQADDLFNEGRKLLADGKTDEACAKFNDAINLDPDAPGTMLNLGLCNENRQKFKSALYWFRKAATRSSETGLPEYEKAAKEHTTKLLELVATIKIVVSGGERDARIKIDGDEIKPEDYLHAEVDPGKHSLDAGATGKKNVHQEFDVVGKGGQTLTITFVAGDNSVVVDRGKGRRHVAIGLGIGGGVLMGASAALAALWRHDYYKYATKDDPPVPYTDNCPGCTAKDALDKANHYHHLAAVWGTTIFVTGAAALTAGIVIYLTAPQAERIDRTVLLPTVNKDGAGFAFTGSF